MSTSWYLLKHVPFEEMHEKLTDWIEQESVNRKQYQKFCVKIPDNGYIWVHKTEIGGCDFEQYNVNQRYEEAPQILARMFGTKAMSEIGQPWDDPDLKGIDPHKDLYLREYPSFNDEEKWRKLYS